jgi:hypothetical protein
LTKQRNREEAVNTQLAILISTLGVTANAETIHFHGKHRPDVLFQLRGLRVVLEGKFADNAAADELALEDARKRVKSGIAHIAAAVIYPDELRSAPTTKLLETLEKANLRFRIIAETHESDDWFEGTPASLMGSLRRAQEALTEDDIVAETAKSLSVQLEGVANIWIGQAGACDRLSALLGIAPLNNETPEQAQDRRVTSAKVAALVLANALIFQELLSQADERVDTLRKLAKSDDLVDATAKHWRWIWENINYLPIFQLGERVLDELSSGPNSTLAVQALLSEAQNICRHQTALRHDLMGRIYHWLLHDAKYLGTYYTSVSAATLLLKIALSAAWQVDFGSPRELADFKVADLACGTGTLLMAAAQALTDNYIRARAHSDKSFDKDLSVLHSTLMQNVIHGYDILPTAVHLTASTLALLAPEVAFRQMNLFVMPIGLDHGKPRLGSLDFLDDNEIKTQFTLDNTHLDTLRTGAGKSGYANAKVPKLDLCVMNPPFVSSRYGNRLFGSLPEDRPTLQRELSKRAKKLDVSATAGLGALFVPLADKHTKIGGRIAFVLPVALATGEAWGAIRKFISERYHLEIVIASHDAERPNFSENTALSEVLFVARRLPPKEKPGSTNYVNLWRNPRSIHEALDLSTRVLDAVAELAREDGESITIQGSNSILGEIARLPAPQGTENWTGAIFAQATLMQVHWTLDKEHKLKVPGQKQVSSLPLTRLDALGTLGYDVRDIFDAFEVDKGAQRVSPHSAFWNHDADTVNSIKQKPNATLLARKTALTGRKLKNADTVWSRAGKVLLVSRLWPVTHKVVAIGIDKKVLGNTWWSFDDSQLTEKQRKALLLWLNSTLGILMYFGRRAITRSAWMQMKKPAWASMPVLDVRSLSEGQLETLAKEFDTVSELGLKAIAHLDVDPTRQKIDSVLCKVFKLPDITHVRELFVHEPGLSARDIGIGSATDANSDDSFDEND